MFDQQMIETEKAEVNILDVDSDTLKLLLEFICSVAGVHHCSVDELQQQFQGSFGKKQDVPSSLGRDVSTELMSTKLHLLGFLYSLQLWGCDIHQFVQFILVCSIKKLGCEAFLCHLL